MAAELTRRSGSTRWRAPLSCTYTVARGKARATSPTPPAWSRWMWVTATPARSPGATPCSSRAASRAGTDVWLPVSTSTGAGPSIRYPAVRRDQPPSSVSISQTPGPM